jgi:ribosomal protein S24E
MNIELKKQRNDLLKRTNVLANIISVKTPSRTEILAKIAAMLGVEERLVIIDNIEQNYGKHSCVAYVKVYDDIETLKTLESKYKLKKQGVKEEPKSEAIKEDKKEEPKSEAVKEDKKEEPKSETVKEDKKEEPKSEAVKEDKKEEPKSEAVKEDKKEE